MKFKAGDKEFTFLVGRMTEKTESTSYDNEVDILNNFVDSYLTDYKDKLHIVSNSSSYTTLRYGIMDLIRLKYSEKAKWLTIFMPPKVNKEYIDNDLFTNQKNKNQIHWKSFIDDSSELSNFVEICLKDIDFIDGKK